jgi:hypothetical protein
MVYIGIDIGKSGFVAACPFYLPTVSFFAIDINISVCQ